METDCRRTRRSYEKTLLILLPHANRHRRPQHTSATPSRQRRGVAVFVSASRHVSLRIPVPRECQQGSQTPQHDLRTALPQSQQAQYHQVQAKAMRVAQSLMTDDLMIHYFFPLPGDAPARERHHLYLHATIFVNTQIAEERRNYHPLPELLRKLSVTHYIIVYFAILPKLRYHQLCRMTNR